MRGAAGREFSLTLKNFRKNVKPKILVLLETRCSGTVASKVIKKWGFKHFILEEARGLAGGIWILWDDDDVKLQVLMQTTQLIHCRVSGLGGRPWAFSAIYASPREAERKCLWDDLFQLSVATSEPWLLAGDFNDIKDASEQRGGTQPSPRRCRNFLDNINKCSLIDLGADGPKYTWRGPVTQLASRLFKRLDRGLCNVEWRTEFGDARV